MTVPYTFANQSGPIPASELDANFAAVSENVTTADTVVSPAQPNITSVGTLSNLTVAGTVTATSFVGNVSGSFANAVYANTAGTANNVSNSAQPNITSVGILTGLRIAGNVTANYYIGNGSQLTGFTFNSNAIVGNTLANNVIYSNLTTVGALANLTVVGNVAGGNLFGGNLSTSGLLLATGNISTTANVVTGNINISGIVNAAGTLNTATTVIAQGNIRGGNLISNGLITATGTISGSNIVVTGTSSRYLDVDIPNTANITATGTYSLSNTSSINLLIANNTGYTATLNMPTAPVNGQICNFAVHGNTVTLAVGTGTVLPSFAGSATVGTGYRYVYQTINSSWYKIG